MTRAMGSEYMEWAKLHSAARFNLASSGVVEYPLADLPVRVEDLVLSGPGAYGWPGTRNPSPFSSRRRKTNSVVAVRPNPMKSTETT